MPRNDGHRFRPKGTLTYVTVGVLTLAVAGLTGFALMHDNERGLSAAAAEYTPPTLPNSVPSSPSASPTPSAQASVPAATPTPTATAPTTPPRVVFVGDGYTAAVGATAPGLGFPTLVGNAEHWNVDVVACAGAGYVVSGSCGTNYAGLIPKVVAAQPSIVVVTGGRNDTPQYQSSAQAANTFFAQLAAAVPNAKIYAISPVWDSTDGQMPLGVVQQSVRTAASAHGATYVDIGEPLRGHPELISSGVMPNDAGYAAIASAIENALPNQ